MISWLLEIYSQTASFQSNLNVNDLQLIMHAPIKLTSTIESD